MKMICSVEDTGKPQNHCWIFVVTPSSLSSCIVVDERDRPSPQDVVVWFLFWSICWLQMLDEGHCSNCHDGLLEGS